MKSRNAAAEAGRTLGGRYRLVAPLATGGMGTVWRAHDDVLDRPVAVKEVLLPPGLDDESRQLLRRRTLREARAAARLRHPAIVTVYDVVEQDDRPWIVMELVPAQSLDEVVRGRGPLPPTEAAAIGLRILDALVTAQAAGVQHRDIKPANVLLAEDGRVVLTDFGIARHVGDETLTSAGLLVGSPNFLAPERARGLDSEGLQSDLWSLGATLYAAVEGHPPFERNGPLPTLAAVVMDEPPPPHRAGPLRPLIDALLVKNPARRLDANRARTMLQRVLRGQPAGWSPVPPQALPEPPPEPTLELPVVAPPAPPEVPDRDRPRAAGTPEAPDAAPAGRAAALGGAAAVAAGAAIGEAAKEAEAARPGQGRTPTEAPHPPDTTAKPTGPGQGRSPTGTPKPPDTTAKPTGPGQGRAPTDTPKPPDTTAKPTGPGRGRSPAGAPRAPEPAAGPGDVTTPTGAPKPPDTTAEPTGQGLTPTGSPRPLGTAAEAAGPGRGGTPTGAPHPPDTAAAAGPPTREGPPEAAAPETARLAGPEEPGRPRARRARVVAALVALAVVAGLAAVLVPLATSGNGGQSQRQAAPTASASPSAQATSPHTATSAPASPSPRPAATSPAPAPAAPGIPAGFTRYTDPKTGFSVAVPVGWSPGPGRTSAQIDFTDPRSDRFLRIETTDTPQPDPYTNWVYYERVFRQGKSDYTNLGIRRVDYGASKGWSAADWEFTLGDRHVLDRNILVGPRRAHAIYWSTPQSMWNTADSRRIFQVAAATFQPAPVG